MLKCRLFAQQAMPLPELRKVPDGQTLKLMVSLRRNIEKGLEIPEAFRKAQKEMKKKYQEFYYWASFVLIE